MLGWIPATIHDDLVGFAFALATAAVLFLFRSRVKLIYGRANNSRNVVFSTQTDEDQEKHSFTEIYVEKFYVQNAGRATATKVEFVLSAPPTDMSIYPPMVLESTMVGKGQWHTLIPQIAPYELVIIDCLYVNQRASWVSSVKCAEGVGKEVEFWTLRRYGNWLNWVVGGLLLLGVAFLFSLVVQITSSQ